jgi:hypothetical protein
MMRGKRITNGLMMAIALAATCANATIIELNGISGNNNNAVPSGFGSNLSSDVGGATVSNGKTPDIALTWAGGGAGGWDLHGDSVSFWAALDPAGPTSSTPTITQMEAGSPQAYIDFTVAAGKKLVLNSVDIGMATDKTSTYNWTITIAEVGGAVVATYNPPAMDGDGSSGVKAQTVTLNFTGDLGVDYRLQFSDSPDTNGAAIDNLSFNQNDGPAVLLDGSPTSGSIAANAPPGSAVGVLTMQASTGPYTFTELTDSKAAFEIIGDTLRTTKFLDDPPYTVEIKGEGSVSASNTFTITLNAATYSAFVASAGVTASVPTVAAVVATLEARDSDGTAIINNFSIVGGRDDLFQISGNELQQQVGADPGAAADPGDPPNIHYVTLFADGVVDDFVIVAIEVGAPPGTVIRIR